MKLPKFLQTTFKSFDNRINEKGILSEDLKQQIEKARNENLDEIEKVFSDIGKYLSTKQNLSLLRIKIKIVNQVDSFFLNYVEEKEHLFFEK